MTKGNNVIGVGCSSKNWGSDPRGIKLNFSASCPCLLKSEPCLLQQKGGFKIHHLREGSKYFVALSRFGKWLETKCLKTSVGSVEGKTAWPLLLFSWHTPVQLPQAPPPASITNTHKHLNTLVTILHKHCSVFISLQCPPLRFPVKNAEVHQKINNQMYPIFI